MQRQELLRQLDQRQDALYKLVEDFQKALKHLSLDDVYHYRVIFRPSVLLPDIEVQTP
jgi:hypothetical protein